MNTRQVSIAFQTDKPLAAYGELAQAAETYGFDGVSVYSDMLYQPPWLPLLEIARHTRRVRIGPAAVNPFTCHPLNIAGNIALLDEASDGRAYLGLTRGSWLDYVGITPARPVTAVREAMECVRHLLTRSPAPYNGKVFQLSGGDALRWDILRADIPFLLGAWSEKTIHACLPHISEIKLGGTANPALVRRIRAFVDAAAVQIGREPQSIGIVAGTVSVVGRDGQAALDMARRAVALYLAVVAKMDPTLNIEPGLLQRIQDAAAEYDFDRAAGFISDDLLKYFAFAGTPEQVAQQAEELFEAGAQRVEFGTPHGATEEEGMRLLGEGVLPRFRE